LESTSCASCGAGLEQDRSSKRRLVAGLAALVGVGLATIGLEALLNRLMGWPAGRKGGRQP
jgi:hypothetical protein